MQREPIFNVPKVVAAVLGALILIHLVREYVLSEDADLQLLLTFAFIPARYDSAALVHALGPPALGAPLVTACAVRLLDLGFFRIGSEDSPTATSPTG